MPIPTPEEMQYLLGIHPDQVMASQALVAAANGGAQPESGDVTPTGPLPKPRPLSTANPAPDAVSEITPKPSLTPRSGPRALNVPPVGTPGPIEGTIATGTEDQNGRPMLAKAGPDALPVGAVPPAAEAPAPPPAKPVDMSSVRNLMTTPIRPLSGDQAREQIDRAELDRLRSTGSGVDQFMHRHHVIGPIVKGLTIAGSILAPGPASMIPGTDLHHQVLEHQAEGRVAQDIGAEKAHSQIANSEEAQATRAEAERSREQHLKDTVEQQNQKFVAGSEHEDVNSPTGYVAQTIGGEWKPFTPPASYKQTKGEGFEDVQRQREKEADRLGLQGDQRTSYIANGKIAEPGTHIHVPSAASEELHDWKEAFKRDHGRDPNADEIAAFKHGGKGTPAHAKDRLTFEDHWAKRLGPGSAVEKKYDSQRQAVLKSYGADKDPQEFQNNKADIEQKFSEIEANREAEKAALQQEKDTEAEEYGVYNHGAPGKPAVAAPAATEGIEQPIASVRTPGPAPIGGKVQTPEKPAKPSPSTPADIPKPPQPGAKLDPTNPQHKQIAQAYLKAAGGDKNKARELAKHDGWGF